uniref:Transcription elongation factor 1 homolog n=1 Tax=Hemiselmis tepida TaxID=464990 RepID=A0A7S0VTE8_9CRYP|mmetsp:Transcript_22507/g.56812  ORF Transcript_22507/g.56812 Transcript_22507/m.56812 type:complete len:110 (+) Transcript_22507:140-469(+)
MGKRKTAKKVQKKERPKVMGQGQFDCPSCNHAGSIKVSILKKEKVGKCVCNVCGTSYATKITALSEPVDIYCEWIDECEKANKPAPSAQAPLREDRRPAAAADDDEDDD